MIDDTVSIKKNVKNRKMVCRINKFFLITAIIFAILTVFLGFWLWSNEDKTNLYLISADLNENLVFSDQFGKIVESNCGPHPQFIVLDNVEPGELNARKIPLNIYTFGQMFTPYDEFNTKPRNSFAEKNSMVSAVFNTSINNSKGKQELPSNENLWFGANPETIDENPKLHKYITPIIKSTVRLSNSLTIKLFSARFFGNIEPSVNPPNVQQYLHGLVGTCSLVLNPKKNPVIIHVSLESVDQEDVRACVAEMHQFFSWKLDKLANGKLKLLLVDKRLSRQDIKILRMENKNEKKDPNFPKNITIFEICQIDMDAGSIESKIKINLNQSPYEVRRERSAFVNDTTSTNPPPPHGSYMMGKNKSTEADDMASGIVEKISSQIEDDNKIEVIDPNEDVEFIQTNELPGRMNPIGNNYNSDLEKALITNKPPPPPPSRVFEKRTKRSFTNNDHSTANNYHSTANNDHSTANNDHSTANNDRSTANNYAYNANGEDSFNAPDFKDFNTKEMALFNERPIQRGIIYPDLTYFKPSAPPLSVTSTRNGELDNTDINSFFEIDSDVGSLIDIKTQSSITWKKPLNEKKNKGGFSVGFDQNPTLKRTGSLESLASCATASENQDEEVRHIMNQIRYGKHFRSMESLASCGEESVSVHEKENSGDINHATITIDHGAKTVTDDLGTTHTVYLD